MEKHQFLVKSKPRKLNIQKSDVEALKDMVARYGKDLENVVHDILEGEADYLDE